MRSALFALALVAVAPAVQAAAPVQICNAVWSDPARAGRQVPVRIRMPAGTARVPLVLFSHGLGSLDSGTDWAEAWAESGIAVVSLQHPGSDRGIFAGGGRIRDALFGALSPQQLVARAADVRFAIDEIGRRRREGACDLARIDLKRIGMSGHSFGAITTQAIAGQRYPLAAANGYADPRVTAAIAFSPSPAFSARDADAFGTIRMPFFSITGTADVVPITPGITAEDRQRPYRAMPAGGKYLLVLDGANHMEFNGQDTLRNGMRPDPHVRAVTIAATTAFWRATLLGDRAAAAWLADGKGLKAMLQGADRLEAK